jgi:hypothetical protein
MSPASSLPPSGGRSRPIPASSRHHPSSPGRPYPAPPSSACAPTPSSPLHSSQLNLLGLALLPSIRVARADSCLDIAVTIPTRRDHVNGLGLLSERPLGGRGLGWMYPSSSLYWTTMTSSWPPWDGPPHWSCHSEGTSPRMCRAAHSRKRSTRVALPC